MIFDEEFKIQDSNLSFIETLLNNLNEGVHIINPDFKILFANPASEGFSGYAPSDILGETCPKNLLLQLDGNKPTACNESCPALKTMQTGEMQNLRVYIHHQDGHILPATMKILPLRNKSGQITGAVELFSDISPKMTMPEKQIELERMDLLDQLTGLGNQRYLRMHLLSRINEMTKYRISFGILFIDVDNLSRINDTYGIAAGDKILKMIGRTISQNIRFYEAAGRWGDDKFIAVMMNMDENKLDLVANKLRLLLEKSSIRELDTILRSTVSIGATSARFSDTIDTIIERAVELTSFSKRLGKNRVSFRIPTDDD